MVAEIIVIQKKKWKWEKIIVQRIQDLQYKLKGTIKNKQKMKTSLDEISKLIKAFPKDIAALDKRSVLAKVNSQGSGTQKPSADKIPKLE